MSWFDFKGWIQNLGIQIIKSGKVPRHVAFILDGNRRYARKLNTDQKNGYSLGCDNFEVITGFCKELGVTHLTAYGFSIENFKRSPDEVSTVMDLFRKWLINLTDKASYKERTKKYGIRLRVVGDLSKLPDDLRKLIARAIHMSKDNNSLVLTAAISYTSRNEITESVATISKAVEEERINLDDINQNLVDKCLYTEDSIPVDLLIRTSGETRLSDFMLWQGSTACLYFSPLYWPEFSVWELLKAIFQYQINFETLRRLREMENGKLTVNKRVEKFLRELYKERLDRHLKEIREELH